MRRDIGCDRGRTWCYPPMLLKFAFLQHLFVVVSYVCATRCRGTVAYWTEVFADRPVLLLIGQMSICSRVREVERT